MAPAYVISLLPEPANLSPALMLIAGMLLYYLLRLTAVDRMKVTGPRSLGDVLLLLLTVAEAAVLLAGWRHRRRARLVVNASLV